jgi:ATP synthase protein I
MDQKREPQGKNEGIGEAYRKAGPWLDASWQLTGSLALWVVVGYLLDRWLGTRPWLLVAGSVLGMILGFYLFFRAVAAIGKRE